MRCLSIIFVLTCACGGSPYDGCDLSWTGEDPVLGEMVFKDGTRLAGGSYNHTIRNGRLSAGTFTINVRADGVDEPSFDEALMAGFPICRHLDRENDSILYNDSGGAWITDSSHTGTLAIASREGQELVGMVSAELISTTGAIRQIDAAFRLGPSD